MKLYGKNANQIAHRIIEAFQHPERLPKALTPLFIHRKDDIPSRKWSWHNQLLVALAGTRDARGIRQWNRAGRKVKKGSKALYILAPCMAKKSREEDDEEPMEVLYAFRAVPVFAIEDTEGDAIDFSSSGYEEFLADLPFLEVAEAWNITVEAFTHQAGDPMGYYRQRGGNEAIMLSVQDVPTFLHELVHAADKRAGGLKEAKWHREIVAELGAAVLSECLGLDEEANLGGAYAYIESYAQSNKMSTVKACIDVLDHTCRCVSLILDTAESLSASRATA